MRFKPTPIPVNMQGWVEIEFMAWDESTIKAIASANNLPLAYVRAVLAVNIITYSQLALITGRAESTIRFKTIRKENRKTGDIDASLTACNPFPDTQKGPAFVLVDDKCKQFILDCIPEEWD